MADRALSTSRRTLLAAPVALAAAPAALAAPLAVPAAAHPDAELLRLCEAHAAAKAAFENDGLDAEDSPLWGPYDAICDRITATRAHTMDGVIAKGRAAIVEASGRDGTIYADGAPGCEWAFDVLKDFLRIAAPTGSVGA